MSSATDLQDAIISTLRDNVGISSDIPIVAWRRKDSQSDMDAAIAAQKGLAIFVAPPVPTSAMQGTPFVFFDGYECRVQIVELPEINRDGIADMYDLIDAIALALHWQPKAAQSPLAGMLAHPLSLASRPVETAEGTVAVPGFEGDGRSIRAADVIFNAVLQLNEEKTP